MRVIVQWISRAGVFAIAFAVAAIALSQGQPVSEGINRAGEKQVEQPPISPVIGKYDYRETSDVIEVERERLGIQESDAEFEVSSRPLIGTWVNADRETGGLVRVIIAREGKEVTIHAFGACAPTACDQGIVNGIVYAENVASVPAVAFTAKYTYSFKQTLVVGHLVKGSLQIQTFDHFTDESGRADYYSLAVMTK